MRYLNHHDDPDGYESDYLPRKPRPAVTHSGRDEHRRESRRNSRREPRYDSKYDPGREARYNRRRESRHDPDRETRRHSRASRDPYHRERRDRETERNERERLRESPSKRARSSSRERRRRERRAARYAEDPEGEAQRQERRRERRARRDERRRLEERDQGPSTTTTDRGTSPVKETADQEDWDKDAADEIPPDQQHQQHQQHQPNQDTSNTSSTVSKTYDTTTPSPNSSWEDYPAYGDDWDLERGQRPSIHHRGRRESRARHSRPPPSRKQSYYSSEDGWSIDYDEKERSHSNYDELHWYKYGNAPDRYAHESEHSGCCCGFSRRCTIWSSIVAGLITLIIIIVVAVVVSRNHGFSYHTSDAQVNNTAAFASGGATHGSVNDTKDGIGAGTDSYKYYQGKASKFPNHTLWISFEDMWNNNRDNIKQSCGWLNYGEDDSDEEIQDIYNAIQDRANASLVDHRLVLALILQESHGCVRVPHTTSSGGVHNTGLMQAHNGAEFHASASQKSILAMVQDGTQGTKKGNGLVQELNMYGDPYKAARAYNSGYIPKSGDLSEAAGATACYVSDVANRLTGWVKAKSSCPGSE